MDGPKLFVGLDSSTQRLSAVVIEVQGDERRVALETSLLFDEALPHYGTQHGISRVPIRLSRSRPPSHVGRGARLDDQRTPCVSSSSGGSFLA